MAIQVHNFPKKNFGESSIHTMPHFSVNSPAWWNSPEQQFPMSLSKNLSLKVGSTPELRQEPKKHLGVQAQEQDSSSTQLTGQSHQEVTAVGGTDSQDQCISSDSGIDALIRDHQCSVVCICNQTCTAQIISPRP